MGDSSARKEKPFHCSFEGCNKSFARKDCLQLHVKSHTGEKSYECDTLMKDCGCITECSHPAETPCGKTFISSSHLLRHKKTHRDLFIHICSMCLLKFKKKSQLRQHKLDCHGIAEFQCEEDGCGRHFVSKAKLIIHQQSRHGGHMCPVITCAAMFPSQESLLNHVASHDPNVSLIKKRSRKKSKASILDNNDDDGITLSPHNSDMNLKMIDDFYGDCDFIDALDDDDDDEHIDLGQDGDNDDDIYFISHVGGGKGRKRSRTLSSGALDVEAVASHVSKAFPCPHPTCDRSFTQKKNLEAHIKALHSVARPYPCPHPFCGKAFGFKSVLERHMLRCHGSLSVIPSAGAQAAGQSTDKLSAEVISHA